MTHRQINSFAELFAKDILITEKISVTVSKRTSNITKHKRKEEEITLSRSNDIIIQSSS